MVKYFSTISSQTTKLAARNLINGNIVVFPTETVYGIGADALNNRAVKRIYRIKKRPKKNSLIVHINSNRLVQFWAREIPDYAIELINKFWPGPLTIVVKKNLEISSLVSSGKNTIALRKPNHQIALDLLESFENYGGKGVGAPSANIFTRVSTTNGIYASEDLGKFLKEDDFILEGGDSELGLESTILDCTSKLPKIIRLGSLLKSDVEKIVAIDSEIDSNFESIGYPGNSPKHYSPRAEVRISQSEEIPFNEWVISLKGLNFKHEVKHLREFENISEYAKNLYSTLRKVDEMNLRIIYIVPPPNEGLGEVILDRIYKSAGL